MEVRKDTYDLITTYMDKSKGNSLECEAVLKHKIDATVFTNLLQHLVSSKKFTRHVYDNDGENTLDINALIDSHTVRATVCGTKGIQKYCTSNVVPDDAVIIIKSKVDDPLRLTDYYFNVNLKSEIAVKNDDLKKYRSTLKSISKNFRLKKRFSFYDEQKNFRIDMTVVKSNTTARETFYNTNIGIVPESYEVEIEYMNNYATAEDATNQLLKIMNVILRIVFNTKIVLKKSESHIALLGYLSLVNSDYYNAQLENDTSKMITNLLKQPQSVFFAYNPVTLELRNINTEDVIKNDNILSENGYAVTEKADGERNLLYINATGKVYMINNRLYVVDTGLTSTSVNTLIDGEFITKTKLETDCDVFMCFDIYFDHNDDVRHLPFISDDSDADQKSRYKTLKDNVSHIENKGKSVFKVEVKKFFTTKTNGKAKKQANENINILQVASKHIWGNQKSYDYQIDGLIFQPTKLAVGAVYKDEPMKYQFGGTWNKVFKWKPPKDNSIDMMIEFEIKNTSMEWVFCNMYVSDWTKKKINPINIINGVDDNNDDNKSTNGIQNATQYKQCALRLTEDGNIQTNVGEIIKNRDIVEFAYDDSPLIADSLHRWIPRNIRHDKTALLKTTKKIGGTANNIITADSIWKSIKHPITENMIIGKETVTNEMTNYDDDVYSMRKTERTRIRMKPMMDFHNMYIKKTHLIERFKSKKRSLFDLGCGKGGDMNKYVNGYDGKDGYNLVVGIDQSRDSILVAEDSAWSRYLKNIKNTRNKQAFKNTPMIFVQLSGKENWDGEYFKKLEDEKLKFITQVLWDVDVKKKPDAHEKRVINKYRGRVNEGFDVVNCQFAIHYFFENEDVLDTFCKNLSSVLKVGGYFIGTCFNGKRVEQLFRDEKQDTVIRRYANTDDVMWSIQKKWTDNDKKKIGRQIGVYVESINQEVAEYLVDFDILKEKLKQFNIEVLSEAELNEQKLSSSIGSFEDIYKSNQLQDKYKMDAAMREYSFLNEWFIFKKNAQ
jgi:SAM-dependent methyltransferase